MSAHHTLREANIARQAEWDPSGLITLAYRGNELGGECGEAQNIIKKLERERLGIRGSRANPGQLAEELADVVICADLIAMAEGINLDQAVAAKFNATSENNGLETRLDLATAAERADWVARVMEIREEAKLEGVGSWVACNGCQESVDGHVSTRDYPYSAVFGCQPGGGCSECGGLGVKWDNTDWDEAARFMLACEDADLTPAIMPTRDDLIDLIMTETTDDLVADGWMGVGKPNVLIQGCRYVRRNSPPSPEGYAHPDEAARKFAGFIADRFLALVCAGRTANPQGGAA